jgi:integrase
LVDPVTLLIATGLRRSELLALRWNDSDADAGTIAVAGKLVRQLGVGLTRIDEKKNQPAAGPFRCRRLPSWFSTTVASAYRSASSKRSSHPAAERFVTPKTSTRRGAPSATSSACLR